MQCIIIRTWCEKSASMIITKSPVQKLRPCTYAVLRSISVKVGTRKAGHRTLGLASQVEVSKPVDRLKCEVSLGIARLTILSSP